MKTLIPTMTRPAQNQSLYIPADLNESKYVWVRKQNAKSLERPYYGPFKVISRNRKFFTIETQHGKDTVNIDRLKPAVIEKHVTIQLPRKRGRPRKN
ncbi:hypothetical protein BLA29_014138 [Euroglyphus maynei]|uniref:Uncharacterized protein n=1 Tax=Euroglyphus maynei TaxID=6958 RepID=A0A1Y3B7Z0_EURMA|nr:hypothetical protein BLA29_014138 [Euroglyphus maynei]